VDGEYDRRLALKRAESPIENAIRLGLNSITGKTAQTVGGTKEKPPRWREELWASMVWSMTHAKLFLAGWANRDGLVQFATDALYSTRPIVGCDEGESLGQWKMERAERGLFASVSGIYMLDKGAGRWEIYWNDGQYEPEYSWESPWATKSRGFEKESLTPAAMMNGWRAGQWEISLQARRLWSVRAAAAHQVSWPKAGRFVETPRELKLRADGCRVDCYPLGDASRGMVPTLPAAPIRIPGRQIALSAPMLPPWESSDGRSEEAGPEILED
jgi:hypothetical protein